MATKVQTKAHFLGSVMDLNSGSCNGMWDAFHDDRNSGYNSFLMSQRTMNGYSGYPKEQMRLTILKQESIFRHQLQELHQLYKRQKNLMNELIMNERCKFTVPVGATNSKDMHTQRRVIDLELPADVDEDNERNQAVKVVHNLRTKRAYNLVDLNEPIHMEEASFAASGNGDHCVADKRQQQDLYTDSKFWYLQAEPKIANECLSRNRTIFGVELSESNHKPCSWDQNASSVNHSRWIEPHEQLPHWLIKTTGKEPEPEPEPTLYQMNLDSLQQQSQPFFKKAEKLQTDGIMKILGVPIVTIQDSANLTNAKNTENDKNEHGMESRQDLDLNLSFVEEVDPSLTPSIDLETPAAAIEAEPNDGFTEAEDQELVKSAAEAIISISSSEVPPADTLLWWLAEVIASDNDLVNANKDEDCIIPEGMDEFEYMTLKLQETKEEYHESVTLAENEEADGLLQKRATRKKQGKRGRPRKDFQRDVLPGIVSLSRREVSEDLQIFEQAFKGIGVTWQSNRKSGGKNGRGGRRRPSPPKSVCWDEKSLSGWGKRTRRLPRQRCQNGANHHSLAFKCGFKFTHHAAERKHCCT